MNICYASVNSSFDQYRPPLPRASAGHLPALSVPGVGHLQILRCPQGFKLLEKQAPADWLICPGREKIEEVCKGMFSILCMHFFIA